MVLLLLLTNMTQTESGATRHVAGPLRRLHHCPYRLFTRTPKTAPAIICICRFFQALALLHYFCVDFSGALGERQSPDE